MDLEALFRITNPKLLRLLAANGIRGETAEDLVQQTWERFFTNQGRFEGRSELNTFICGILINKIREHRRASKRIVLEEDSDTLRAFSLEGWWNHPPEDPQTHAYSAEISDFIEECMQGLSENQRQAFILKEVEREKTPEVCNVLGVSVSHLRVLIFRAKEKLRQCLDGKLGSDVR